MARGYIEYPPNKLGFNSTLCWECKNAIGGCSWSKKFKPIKGWNAIETKVKYTNEVGVQSYHVIDCPKFERG